MQSKNVIASWSVKTVLTNEVGTEAFHIEKYNPNSQKKFLFCVESFSPAA